MRTLRGGTHTAAGSDETGRFPFLASAATRLPGASEQEMSMATISYLNDAPVTGLNYNPGLEEVLDPTGVPFGISGQYTAKLYEIVNNDSGPFKDFKVQLTSSANGGAGDFSYFILGETGEILPSGTISGITVRAPDGTIILEVTPGAAGYGDTKIENFYTRLTDPTAESPSEAIFFALNFLLIKSNVFEGSDIADHAVGFGPASFSEFFGGGGDDFFFVPDDIGSARLVGNTGNDTFRLTDRTYEVHGANVDGSGGAGETNTLEVIGYVDDSGYADIIAATDIDALRFVAGDQPVAPSLDGAEAGISIDAGQIGAGLVSLALAVNGSTTASPFSSNYINVHADPTGTTAVKLDLSGWTFTNWNQDRNGVFISTNPTSVAINDTIVGTRVSDSIFTYYGNDTLRGGGGVDYLSGGDGNDTFVYGRNEAVRGERVDGGGSHATGGIADTVLVLGNNNFVGVDFYDIERLKFGGEATATFDQNFIYSTGSAETIALGAISAVVIGDAHANTLAFQLTNPRNQPSSIDISDVKFKSWTNGVDKVMITGTNSRDTISGSTRGDIINGGGGSDDLQGNQGADRFVFNTAFGKGVDHIADFSHKQHDRILIEKDIFTKLKSGTLDKAFFTIGTKAKDGNDRIIYDDDNGVLRYDADGTGGARAKIFAILDNAASLVAADFFVI
jgi:Ca2+-binding RTX toxin-like protein